MAAFRVLAAISLCSVLSLAIAADTQPPATSAPANATEAGKAMYARIRAATRLGPEQAALAKYLGHWSVDIELPGQNQHWKGSADYSWVIEGRWLGCRIKGSMMGEPFEEFTIVGYDSYAQSLVEVSVESADNSMQMARGSFDRTERPVHVLFGDLDEYFTGSLRRPYKVVMRWLDPGRHVTEVWDLGTGEKPAEKVVFTFTRPNPPG